MEVHDIRYLHDDAVSEDDELGGDFSGPPLFTRKNIVGIFVIGILISSIVLVTANISNQTKTASLAKSTKTMLPTPEPTAVQVQLQGKVTCLKSTSVAKEECDIAIQTDDGKTYELKNVAYQDVVSGSIVPGKKVIITGVISGDGIQNSLFVSSVSGSGSSSQNTSGTGASTSTTTTTVSAKPTPTLTATPTMTPTPTPTITPTPTPIPHYIDSVPQPGINYLSIQYIRDHSAELNGTQVQVGAYLVGGYIGVDGCTVVGICTYSVFFLADSNNPNRNLDDDMQMIGSVGEREEDYTTGQNYYHKVTVVIIGGVVSLQKVY